MCGNMARTGWKQDLVNKTIRTCTTNLPLSMMGISVILAF